MGASWPSTLPQSPLRDGYTYDDQDGRTATDMQQGPPRFRRLYTNTPREFNLRYLMTPAQLSTFETFYSSTLQGGAVAVDLPIHNATGKATRECYIVSKQPIGKGEGNDWIIGIKAIST